jgi:D-amino peptidase
MRKFFISADLEGCAAVCSQHDLRPERWEWSAARRWMTLEVVAAAEAALEAGYGEVIVADGHGNAHNIDPDLLPDDVRLVRSWPRPLFQMQGVEDVEVEACAFIGYHAASHTCNSIMAHTYHGRAFREVKLNGEICSEGYLNAALAGEFSKPIIFVSGDESTIEDARRYAPEAVTFASKQSIGIRAQVSLPPTQVCRLLKAAMERALAGPKRLSFSPRGPFRLELEMIHQVSAEMLSFLPGVERVDAWTIASTFNRVAAAMGFIACATLYSPTGDVAL